MKRILLIGLVALGSLGQAYAADNTISTPLTPDVSKDLIKGTALITSNAPEQASIPQSDEIINVLKQHYVDHDALEPQKLNDASVAGILKMLGSGVKLMTAEEAASNTVATIEPTSSQNEPLARVEVIDPEIGYIRLADVTSETGLALDAEFRKFAAKKVNGYVIDLRYADGTNYAASAIVASQFLPTGIDLFTLKQADGAQHTFRTTEAPKTLAPELADAPLMLLVNAQTRGSAEVLAGALRTQDRGIVVGGPTAGLPVAWQDVKLSDGRVLRMATAKISFPKGAEIFPGGIIPDVMVKIDPKTEHSAVFNMQTNVTLTASLLPHLRKREYSEAALVKVFRGESIDPPSLQLSDGSGSHSNALTLSGEMPLGTNTVATAEEESDAQTVRDVVLQRAVDILKGIRVLLSRQ